MFLRLQSACLDREKMEERGGKCGVREGERAGKLVEEVKSVLGAGKVGEILELCTLCPLVSLSVLIEREREVGVINQDRKMLSPNKAPMQ